MNAYPAGISLCMIVKDEEAYLEGALRSVAGVVDEICIVDTGSSDATIAIARRYGARVVQTPWHDDFASARNTALALATRRWILVLDADERLDPLSRTELREIGAGPAHERGKWIRCRNLIDPAQGAGAMTNALVRIFPNDARIRYRNAIHEFVARDGSESGLAGDMTGIAIEHHGYLPDVVAARGKAERNLRLSRAAAQRDPGEPFHQYNLGMALVLGGQGAAAIVPLERMRDLTRTVPRGYRVHGLVVLGELYADERDDTATALERVLEALRIVPDYSNAHFALGRLLARRGEPFEARNAFGRAITAGAHDGDQFVVDNEIAVWKAHSEIGATLMIERRFGEALKWFELAAAARPGAQPLVINRAKCHEALGDLNAARRLFGAAFSMYADERSALEWINFLLRAGRAGEVFDAIEAALPLVHEARRPLVLGTAAAAQLRAGRRSLAQNFVDRALAGTGADAAAECIRDLAAHLGMRELAGLVPGSPATRAAELRIAYVTAR